MSAIMQCDHANEASRSVTLMTIDPLARAVWALRLAGKLSERPDICAR